jgi:hypothetical protein
VLVTHIRRLLALGRVAGACGCPCDACRQAARTAQVVIEPTFLRRRCSFERPAPASRTSRAAARRDR